MRHHHLYRYSIAMVGLLLTAHSAWSAPLHAELERTIRLNGLPNEEVPVITAVAIQPHGHLLATAGDDHIVRLWDVRNGRLLRELRGHQDWVTTVCFCRDGSELITGGRDRQVFIWDTATGVAKGTLGDHQHPISKIIVSDEKDKVVIAGFRAPLKVYDLGTRKLQASLKCPCSDTRAVTLSHDMHFLAAGGRNGRIRIWDLTRGTKVEINAHPGRVRTLVFTNDNRLVSAGDDVSIIVWDAKTGQQMHRLASESGKVLAMTMIGENQIAAASADNVICLFKLDASGPHSFLRGHTGSIAALDFRAGTLISGSFDTTVRVWSIIHAGPDTVSDPLSLRLPIATPDGL